MTKHVYVHRYYILLLLLLIFTLVLFFSYGNNFVPQEEIEKSVAEPTTTSGSWTSSSSRYNTNFDSGNGDANDGEDGAGAYEISTPQQLAGMAYLVNTESRYRGFDYILTADIDLSAYYWTPIGNSSAPFTGSFNGNGHTISGLYINSSSSYQGLFGYVSGHSSSFPAEISNIRVASGDLRVGISSAAIVGYGSNIRISSVKNYVDVTLISSTTGGAVAGILGYATNFFVIQNCKNAGDISISSTNGMYLGGIVGRIPRTNSADYCFIRECSNSGNITGTTGSGGIVGLNEASQIDFYIGNCYNSGDIYSKTSAICGGIIGSGGTTISSGNHYIFNCYNIGTIGSGSSGQSAGIAGTSTKITIINCFNLGTISGRVAYQIIYSSNNSYTTITNCYGTVSGGTGNGTYNSNLSNNAKSSTWLTNSSNWTTRSISIGVLDVSISTWDMYTWKIVSYVNSGYPYLNSADDILRVSAYANSGSFSASYRNWSYYSSTMLEKYIPYGNTYGDLPIPTRSGYRLKNWTTLSNGGTVVDKNSICTRNAIYAQWERSDTSITLDKNNGSGGSSSVTATYGSAMPTITVPTRTGYTFNGYFISESSNNGTGTKYYNSDGTSARTWDVNASTDTLYAGWTIESYTINYDANGGSVSPDSDTVNYNESITLPTPTRTGYAFTGWKYGSSTITDMNYTVPDFGSNNSTVTFIAQYVEIEYTAKFVSNGSTIATYNVTYNDIISQSTPTPSNGYSFSGWKITGDYNSTTARQGVNTNSPNTTISNSQTSATGNRFRYLSTTDGSTITMTAVYSTINYKLTLVENGGSSVNDINYNITSTSTLPSISRTGYNFGGWRVTTAGGSWSSGETHNNGKSVNGEYGNATLTAQWTPITYKLTLVENGGSSVNDINYNITSTSTLPSISRTGYNFGGWRVTTAGGSWSSGETHNNGKSVNGEYGNATLTAQWTPITYKLTLVENGGSSVNDINYNITSTSTLPSISRTGYNFVGWRVTTAGGSWASGIIFNAGYSVIGNHGNATLTAQWNAKTYNSTFNANGGRFSDGATTKSFTMRYNTQDYSMLETYIPTQAGYTFAGWYDSSNTQVYNSQGQSIAGTRYFNSSRNWIYDGIVTFYAHWNANRYTVTFDEDGGSSVSDIVDYTIESTITFPSTGKAGYDFVNWQVTRADGNWTNGATFNANTTTTDKYGNVTLTAQWDYHTYTVTLDPNGGEVSPTSIRVTYQSTYGSLPTPTRDGYVFKGWYTSETSGTQILSTTKYTSTQDTTIYAQWQDTWANHASDVLTLENGYYLISSEEDLARVSYLFNCTDRTDVQTMKFKLTKNLDMSDYTWLPIGTQSRQFRGTFEGNGYIISGLNTYYNSSISSTYTNIGLFGYVNGATIQNLYLRDTDMRGGSNVGGLIGYATGNTQVTSCAFDGSITANSNGGSIVGLGATSVIVSNCTVFSSNTTADTNGMARGCSVRSLVYITNGIKDYIGTDFSNYVFVEGMPAPVPTGLSWLAQGGEPCTLDTIEAWAEN